MSPGLGTGHSFCSAVSQTPGTDASGNFTFTVRGGGVSWSAGDGTSTRGSIVKVAFQEGEDVDYVTLLCGNSATYPVLSAYGGCPSAPEIYGKLASPDLTGDMFVDASDIPLLGSCITGQPTTLVWGWQADFNHDGWADAQDIAYFAGRIQKSCASQKAGASDFDMNVSNLEDPTVGALLVRYGITRSSVIAMWDAMGLSYDRVAANRITASAGTSWAEVKAKYRRP